MQWLGAGLCEQRHGCLRVILRPVYIVVQWDAFSLLYLDVDFRNGQQHGFFYCAALHFIFIGCFSHFAAAMRIAFGTSQWVSFSVASLLIFAGIRFEQWNGFRYAASRCSFTFFAMHFVAAG